MIKTKYLLIAYLVFIFLIAITSDPIEVFYDIFNQDLVEGVTQGIDINLIYHFSAYFLLGILTAFTLKQSKEKNIRKRYLILTLFFTLAIASIDELLQIFTPDRIPDFLDIAYDFTGALISLIFFYKPKKLPKFKLKPT